MNSYPENLEKLNKIGRNTQNSSAKEIDITSLLDTSVWVEDSKGSMSIFKALDKLIQNGINIIKKQDVRFGKIWTVDMNQVNNMPMKNTHVPTISDCAKFINEKAYVLNRSLNNTFIWPELLKQDNKSLGLKTAVLSGGGSKNILGELIATRNMLIMNGGSMSNTASSKMQSNWTSALDKELNKANLKFNDTDKNRLSIMLKKAIKYQERANLVLEYLVKYNKLPVDARKGTDDLESIINKYENQERKIEKVSKNMYNFINNSIVDDKDEKEYYIVKPTIKLLRDHIISNNSKILRDLGIVLLENKFIEIQNKDCEKKKEDRRVLSGMLWDNLNKTQNDLYKTERDLNETNATLNDTNATLIETNAKLNKTKLDKAMMKEDINKVNIELNKNKQVRKELEGRERERERREGENDSVWLKRKKKERERREGKNDSVWLKRKKKERERSERERDLLRLKNKKKEKERRERERERRQQQQQQLPKKRWADMADEEDSDDERREKE